MVLEHSLLEEFFGLGTSLNEGKGLIDVRVASLVLDRLELCLFLSVISDLG